MCKAAKVGEWKNDYREVPDGVSQQILPPPSAEALARWETDGGAPDKRDESEQAASMTEGARTRSVIVGAPGDQWC